MVSSKYLHNSRAIQSRQKDGGNSSCRRNDQIGARARGGSNLAEVEYQGEVLEIFTQDLLERANPVDTRGAGFDEPPCLTNPACDERTAALKAEVDSAHEEFESARAAFHESCKLVPDIGITNPAAVFCGARPQLATTVPLKLTMKPYDASQSTCLIVDQGSNVLSRSGSPRFGNRQVVSAPSSLSAYPIAAQHFVLDSVVQQDL